MSYFDAATKVTHRKFRRSGCRCSSRHKGFSQIFNQKHIVNSVFQVAAVPGSVETSAVVNKHSSACSGVELVYKGNMVFVD